MTEQSIPLSEQIAAVERAAQRSARDPNLFYRETQALAAALATLRGLLLIEETR